MIKDFLNKSVLFDVDMQASYFKVNKFPFQKSIAFVLK